MMEQGYLELIIGPMFSEKSTTLVRKCKDYILKDKSVIILKNTIDKRFDKNVITHSGETFGNIEYCVDLAKFEIEPYDIIGIDEGHFFKGLHDFTLRVLAANKILLISALNADFKKQPFENIVEIFSLAQYIIKLNSKCNLCGSLANFSKRTTNNKEILMVGGSEEYVPRCLKCFDV